MRRLALALTLLLGAPAPAAEKPAVKPPAGARKGGRAAPAKAAPPAAPAREVKVTADNMEVLPGSRKATWRGHVQVDRGDTRIWCDTMVADYDDNKKLTLLTCTGHVHMWQAADLPRHPEREAWGELGVFDNLTGVLTLTGNPHGREGEDTLRGEKITYLSHENRTLVEKPVINATERTGQDAPGGSPKSPGAPK